MAIKRTEPRRASAGRAFARIQCDLEEKMKFPLRGHRWVLTAPLLVLITACSGADDQDQVGGDATADTTPATTQAPPPPPPASASALTDGNIVAILAASGNAEIVPSQAVLDRVENAQVKQFAQHMITQHTALNDTVSTVARQNNITPAPNAVSAQLDSTSSATVQQFQGLSGAQLDRAFMQYMVASHEGALQAVTTDLIPSAQNPQLRATIQQKVLPVVEAHLAEARQILGSLGPS
ncbi:MAG TPA: DUF4142 domain-containing protein [Longimicrobium sp.]|jgi:putative membrane protein|uniref:DUF4142 domain-containing protein n=1 Tax=Longimicrobium sp. TaxID=2029185 RepID=UPI002ED772AC